MNSGVMHAQEGVRQALLTIRGHRLRSALLILGVAIGVATLGIFLPAFVFVALSGPLVPRLRRSPTAGVFLDGVVAASLALMAAVSWQIGRAAVRDVPSVVLATVALLLLVRTRVGSLWLVLGGGLAGLALRGLG